eukprot:1158041-Pelagomonas_calceolata.AAC.7
MAPPTLKTHCRTKKVRKARKVLRTEMKRQQGTRLGKRLESRKRSMGDFLGLWTISHMGVPNSGLPVPAAAMPA